MKSYTEWAKPRREINRQARSHAGSKGFQTTTYALWINEELMPYLASMEAGEGAEGYAVLQNLMDRQDRDHQSEVKAREQLRRRVNELERNRDSLNDFAQETSATVATINSTTALLADAVIDLQRRTLKGRWHRLVTYMRGYS